MCGRTVSCDTVSLSAALLPQQDPLLYFLPYYCCELWFLSVQSRILCFAGFIFCVHLIFSFFQHASCTPSKQGQTTNMHASAFLYMCRCAWDFHTRTYAHANTDKFSHTHTCTRTHQMCLGFLVMLGALLFFHTYLIYTGQTTWEVQSAGERSRTYTQKHTHPTHPLILTHSLTRSLPDSLMYRLINSLTDLQNYTHTRFLSSCPYVPHLHWLDYIGGTG